MDVLRTPDRRFRALEDYPYVPNYVDVPDNEGGYLRMHYVDEGPRNGQPVVMIHGNPTWSYMWRKLIPVLANAGYRAIAVDMIGMGRSDKPAAIDDYSIARHEKWLESCLIDQLDLRNAHFILHDWGGITGLRVVANNQDRVASVIYSNTGFPTWEPGKEITTMNRPGTDMLRSFQDMIRATEDWPHWEMLAQIALADLSEGAKAGFAAPYPEPAFVVGNRAFALNLPTRNDNPMLEDNWRAMEKLKSFHKPFQCIYSDKDTVAPTGYRSVRPHIPGAADREEIILEGGSHFLLEDIPEAYAPAVLKFLSEVSEA
ncbi:MAG: haloalkane dehalogenase [Crocinitomicaceae bacterium]|nr:haloalkane dehalogenase [Crocinitomicaceae bacterium]